VLHREKEGTLAERMRELMREHEMTQAELASEAGVSQSMISKILSGERGRRLSHSTISPIANVLETTSEWLVEGLPADYRRDMSKALRVLGQAAPVGEMNICWGLQLQFQRIRYSRDAIEIADILHDMRKLSFIKVLKRIDSNCPGLPTMISVLCQCCSAVLNRENNIENLTNEGAREISRNAAEVCRNLLLPFIKPDKRSTLFPDTTGAISDSIGVFTRILERYSAEWPEDLHEQLNGLVDSVVCTVRQGDLQNREIQSSIEQFGKQIAPAFATLAREHPEKWLAALQLSCGTRPPKNLPGPLCRLWKRLVLISESGGFGFLREFIGDTLECVWTHIESDEGAVAYKDSKLAEDIIGCVHALVAQCCRYPRFGFYWHGQIKPNIEVYMLKRQRAIGASEDPIHLYLEKMIALIEELPTRVRKSPATSIAIEELTPAVGDADDTLCGLFISIN